MKMDMLEKSQITSKYKGSELTGRHNSIRYVIQCIKFVIREHTSTNSEVAKLVGKSCSMFETISNSIENQETIHSNIAFKILS